jgi:hypothetical protein
MTAAQFAEMVTERGLILVDQFDSWGPEGRFKVTTRWDVISVLQKAR